MSPTDLSKILENIHPDLQRIEDQAPKEAVSTLLNIVEVSVAESKKLKDENQKLKDEINRLKGEQGKPDVKPNKKKDGNVSSEKERKQAEESDEKNREGFKFDKNSLEKLKEQRLPIDHP